MMLGALCLSPHKKATGLHGLVHQNDDLHAGTHARLSLPPTVYGSGKGIELPCLLKSRTLSKLGAVHAVLLINLV